MDHYLIIIIIYLFSIKTQQTYDNIQNITIGTCQGMTNLT